MDLRENTSPSGDARRPLAIRGTQFARALTAWLLRTRITPNQISLLSMVFAALGALALLGVGSSPWLYLAAIMGVQLRLLCNLLDGMVAVEGGRGAPIGALYNEIPDRVSDTLLIVALGYAAGYGWLGWTGALFATLTAYLRALGGALGFAQDFRGPMAKQHRMAALTIACGLAAVETRFDDGRYVLILAAAVIAIGSLATCATRLRALAAHYEQAPHD